MRGRSAHCEGPRWILQDEETCLLGQLPGLLQVGFSPLCVLLAQILFDQRVQDGRDHVFPAGKILGAADTAR